MNVHAEFSDKPISIQLNSSNTTSIESDQQIVRSYVDPPSLPVGGQPGDLLAKRSSGDYDVEWITPANSAEEDNTRPITAAAVYTEIGNINALLSII